LQYGVPRFDQRPACAWKAISPVRLRNQARPRGKRGGRAAHWTFNSLGSSSQSQTPSSCASLYQYESSSIHFGGTPAAVILSTTSTNVSSHVEQPADAPSHSL
jgi:hypothetical protein